MVLGANLQSESKLDTLDVLPLVRSHALGPRGTDKPLIKIEPSFVIRNGTDRVNVGNDVSRSRERAYGMYV